MNTLPLLNPPNARGAEFDRQLVYRYRLWRRWNPELGAVAWIMLNPSTADADEDDPTIGRCLGFAKAWGYGGIEVVNLFAVRGTEPSIIRRHRDPIGPLNDKHILQACEAAALVVAAWGNYGAWLGRSTAVKQLLHARRVCVKALDVTFDGEPKHPLYIKADKQLVPFLGVQT